MQVEGISGGTGSGGGGGAGAWMLVGDEPQRGNSNWPCPKHTSCGGVHPRKDAEQRAQRLGAVFATLAAPIDGESTVSLSNHSHGLAFSLSLRLRLMMV